MYIITVVQLIRYCEMMLQYAVCSVLFCIGVCDPCLTPNLTWSEENIIDIIPGVPDCVSCQEYCYDGGVCVVFTWYSSLATTPLACVLFTDYGEERSCQHCVSGPPACPPSDLLLVGESLLLDLPSFTPSLCTTEPYPGGVEVQYSVSGVVGSMVIICGGRDNSSTTLSSCYSLAGQGWQEVTSLSTPRSGAAASLTPGGALLVTGGHGHQGYQ